MSTALLAAERLRELLRDLLDEIRDAPDGLLQILDGARLRHGLDLVAVLLVG